MWNIVIDVSSRPVSIAFLVVYQVQMNDFVPGTNPT